MSFGENVANARKKKKLSQSELAKEVGTIAVTIGRYERNEIKPSIDIATKIADVLDVSLDYLVGNTDTVLEKDLLKKITDIQKLPDDKKMGLWNCSIPSLNKLNCKAFCNEKARL